MDNNPSLRFVNHADYPHEPGTLYDCPVCESQCFCDHPHDKPNCIWCANNGCLDCEVGIVVIYRDGSGCEQRSVVIGEDSS